MSKLSRWKKFQASEPKGKNIEGNYVVILLLRKNPTVTASADRN